MTGDEGGRLRRWLRQVSRTMTLRQVLAALAAVVVLASGLFGGLATAETTGPAALESGEKIHAEPFDLTVDRVRWSTDLGLDEEVRGRYIAVVATLENTSDHPVYTGTLRDTMRLRGLEGFYAGLTGDETERSEDATPQVLVLADGSPLSAAAPGLEYEVAFVWEQEESEPLPTEATVEVSQWTWRRSTLDDQFMWFDRTPTHEGTFDVEQGRES
ncbi:MULTISPECIES: hypothetical protein [Aeromicrobium]|uniref:hypothetical protein n=1 Tax=Aeromicrobium TaxID=2040 RepID=UPI00257C0CBD|nr:MULTISPECIES: hypothetical protein [Aeromicrobium]